MDYSFSSRLDGLDESATLAFAEKVQELKRAGKDIVDLTAGEPDFDAPVLLKQAANRAIEAGRSKYLSSRGLKELRESIAMKLERENSIRVNPAQEIIVTPGAKQALFYAFIALLNSGDEVLIPEPYWVSYKAMVELAHGKLVTVPTTEMQRFKVTPQAIEQAITPRTKILVLVNPNNPTGTLLERRDLEAIAEVVARHNLLVTVDEIYEKIVFDEKEFVSFASLPGMPERTITVNGFSKALAVTGWRIGYAAGPAPIIAQMIKLQSHTGTCANSIAQYAVAEALASAVPEVKAMAQEYEVRRNMLVEGIKKLRRFSCVAPQGAFYLFLNVKQFGKSSLTVAQELLEKAGVATVPGSAFGEAGEGYVRLSFATSENRLHEGLSRLSNYESRN